MQKQYLDKPGIRLNKGEEVTVEVQYAWQDNPAKLSNNLGQAVKIAENEKEKLVKERLTEEFHEKSDEFTRLGTLRELYQHEMDSWVGPSNYVSTQHMRKPENKTTTVRLAMNSSLKCPRIGLSLIGMMVRGPSVLGGVWELLWFMGNRGRYRDMVQGRVYTGTMKMTLLEHMVLSYEENTERCMSTKLAENLMEPKHADKAVELGIRLTRKGGQTMFAYIKAMRLQIKQTMPATRIAFQDRK